MQKIVIYIFTIYIIGFICKDANAQRKIKYKDVYDMVLTGNQQKAYSLLLEYQKQDPEFINTYLQLGIISFDWAKNYDPLTDIELVDLFVYNTKLYYGLAKGKLQADDKDIKKNKDYYMNVEILKQIDKIEFQDAVTYIDSKVEEIKKHDKNVHEIAGNFYSSVEYYNTCVDIYMDINLNNNKLKNIYLYPTEDLNIKIKKIVSAFDSSMFFFEKYKNAIKNYPIKNYNQVMEIKPIETFRLEGLTNSNFLEDTILIWDYKTWAQKLETILNTDINDLRKSIISTNKEINDKEVLLKKLTTFSDDLTNYYLDNKLIFKIEKFDYNSIISSLLNFRTSKIDFLVHSQKIFNNPFDTIYKIQVSKKAKMYYQSVLKYYESDSLLEILNQRTNQKNVIKYESFLTVNYNGLSGLQNYYTTEKKELKTILSENFNNLKKAEFYENYNFTEDSLSLEYLKSKIPFFINNPKFSTEIVKQNYTTATKIDQNNDFYVTGYTLSATGSQAYIAKTDKKSQILWFKSVSSLPNNYEFGTFIEPLEKGCFYTVHSQYNGKTKNTLYKFNETGTQISKLDLTENKFPRYIKFDQINESIVIAYKGTEFNTINDLTDSLIIEKINLQTQKSEWKVTLNITGNLFEILKIDTTYYVFCNFNSYKDLTGKSIISKAGTNELNKNIVIIKIGENGKILGYYPYFSTKAFFGIKAIKISNEVLNIMAIEGIQKEINSTKILETSSLIYILIDQDIKQIYSNWQD